MTGNYKKGAPFSITFMIIAGILLSYIFQIAPSPILITLRDYFGITNNDALLNLAVSIVYIAMTLGCIAGGAAEKKIGVKNLYTAACALLGAGLILNFAVKDYWLFLLGRFIFGVGFGLGVPFIGAAIMKWYPPEKREAMNTLNGLFPFMGTLIAYSLINWICTKAGSWKTVFGIFGIIYLLIMTLWAIKANDTHEEAESKPAEAVKENVYRLIWKIKEIRLLTIIFVCDFFCYSYVAVILPTLLYELNIGVITEAGAGLIAAFAFPALGIAGCALGGFITAKKQKRRGVLIMGQVMKFLGILAAVLGMKLGFGAVLAGIALYGFGTGYWMPIMYIIPMDLDNMDPAKVGAAFALASACGFICGFISPTIGGWLTDVLAEASLITESIASHLYGLKWSMFIFGFTNLLSTICAVLMRETGNSLKKQGVSQ